MREVNLTEGSIFRKLIGFSMPTIAGNLLQQIYNLADAAGLVFYRRRGTSVPQ